VDTVNDQNLNFTDNANIRDGSPSNFEQALKSEQQKSGEALDDLKSKNSILQI